MPKSYYFYFFIVIILILSITGYTITENIKDELEMQKMKLSSDLSNIQRTKKKIKEILKVSEEKGIKPVTKEKAVEILITEVDRLVSYYDGKITSSIEDNHGYYSIGVQIEYYPDREKDLAEFLEKLLNSYQPFIVINSLDILNQTQGTKVVVNLSVIQPYIEVKK